MDRDLFSLISDEQAQVLVGGGEVTSGVTFVDAGTNGWHHLGLNHQDPDPDETASGRHDFTLTAGESSQTPTSGSQG